MSAPTDAAYPARLNIDYPDRSLDRFSTFFRMLFAIPIMIVMAALGGGLGPAVGLMIVFRQKYPRWWFDFNLEYTRFTTRVSAYLGLMNDTYPSTDEEQTVHVELDYPDAKQGLNRWLPLVKWLLALPHYVVLVVLFIGAFFAVLIAWFAILFTGRYPRGLFTYVEGVNRWGLRVQAYVSLLITDRYPPFSLK
ncbi:MAG: DUF4389 domain-containing protein [Actinobacteria bacterium]|nr:DUF4389 domain-containing protein [Actinomycetota bacterium]